MADETLRLQAEIVDRFSGPLKSLRAQLLDAGREGAKHGETLAKGLNKAEAAAQATANTAKTVLNPALAAIGVTGLGAGVAVSGVVSALNSLGSNLSGLGALSRETSMAADQLRVFQSVAGKFGISSDASAAAAKTFSQNMRDIRRGVGETMGFLQSQSPAVAEFAIKLKNTTSNDEANKLTEEFLERVPNPVDRGRLAERFYGNAEFGRLGDRSRGPIRDLNRATEQKLGPLPKEAVESAERYERALADLRSSMSRIGQTIAMELLPPAEKFSTWLDDVVSGKRGDVTAGLREGIRGIKTELEAINWKQAGDDAAAFLKESTALAGSMAKAFHDIAETIHALREGEYLQALRGADGAQGPLARKLAPRVGDDELDAQEAVDRLRKLRDVSKEAAGHFIGQTQQRMGLMDSPEAAQKKLDAAEAELSRLKARTPEQRQKDYDASSERLRKSIDGLSEQLKTQQGATAQKSSLDADGLFGDARVQAASLGGARIYGGPGGTGPIPEAQRNAARESFRKYLMQRVPGYDGNSTVPTLPDGTIPGLGYKPGAGGRTPSMGGGNSRLPGIGGGSEIVPPGLNTATGTTREVLDAIASGESGRGSGGYNVSLDRGRWLPSGKEQDLTKLTLDQIDALQTGMLQNPANRTKYGNGLGSSAIGRYQIVRKTLRGLRRNMGLTGKEVYDEQMQDRLAMQLFSDTRGQRSRLANEWQSLRGRKLDQAVNLYQRWRADPGAVSRRVAGMERPDVQAGGADGEGWAAREKARKAFEAMQQGEGRLDASAARAGVVGGQKVEANGSVSVVVQRPGPDTNVRTSASGNLFKDVVLSRGKTMAPAERG